jgi:DNA-binding transcriptional MerR regulator
MPVRHASGRPLEALPDESSLPDKLYFRIGEVSALTKTKPYVLRYWETEFPMLRPAKSKSGHRHYRRQDVVLVLKIKNLLYDKGFTIEGARRELKNHSKQSSAQPPLFRSNIDVAELKALRREIQGILTMLSKRC